MGRGLLQENVQVQKRQGHSQSYESILRRDLPSEAKRNLKQNRPRRY
jgi:hypothetical protein